MNFEAMKCRSRQAGVENRDSSTSSQALGVTERKDKERVQGP